MALLTSQQLAAELGFTAKQIRKLAKLGTIPSEKYASEYRFDLGQVRAAATYHNPLAASAHRAARSIWIRPRRRSA